MHMDIRFPNTPCYLIELGLRTGVNSVDHRDLVSMMTLSHQTKGGQKVEYHINDLDANSTTDNTKEFFDQKLECRIKGSIDMAKVTG